MVQYNVNKSASLTGVWIHLC